MVRVNVLYFYTHYTWICVRERNFDGMLEKDVSPLIAYVDEIDYLVQFQLVYFNTILDL